MHIGSILRQPDPRALIRNHPFFKGLNENIISQLVAHLVTRKVKKNTVLFRKGDVGTTLYLVSAGVVRITTPSRQGKDAVFNLIVPGEIFGEIAFLDGGQRTADAIMAGAGELLVIERRDFMPLLEAHPELATRLLKILCGRLRKTSEQVEDIIFLDLPIRLAKAVLYLHRQADPGSAGGEIRITQRELSQMVGASREGTTRELRNWQQRKWRKLKRAGLVVLAPEALTRLIAKEIG